VRRYSRCKASRALVFETSTRRFAPPLHSLAPPHFCLPQNDLSYFRIATKKFEIMVAPHFGNVKYTAAGAQKDKGYTLFVLQRKPGQTA
jgi:hypothetical protein